MTDYANGKIYRVIDNTTGRQYIGSTASSLPKRLYKHKNHYKRYCEDKMNYISVYDIIKNGDYHIVLIELFPCNSKMELEQRERHFIDTMDCVNKNRPRTEEEKKEYKRQYNAKDETKEKKKEYYQQNKEYYQKYRDEHKENHSEYHKEHYEANKAKYLQQAKARREAIKNDPELLAQHREYQKLKAREYREKKKLASTS